MGCANFGIRRGFGNACWKIELLRYICSRRGMDLVDM